MNIRGCFLRSCGLPPSALRSAHVAQKEGYEEGREERCRMELRQTIRDFCGLLSIELTDERNAYSDKLDITRLEALRDQIKQHKAWV